MFEALAGKRVFVTGATGFLGGQLARLLAQEGATVKALARKIERAAYIKDVFGVEVVLGDITEPQRLRELMAGCEVVYHVAAAIYGSESLQRQVNVAGTQNVMNAAADAGVRRVVHISTMAVYGYGYNGDVYEDFPLNPANEFYGRTKAEAEGVVQMIAAQRGIEYAIIRPAFIYGPRSGAWTGQIFDLARRTPIPFVGGGKGHAHPVYVDDVCGLTMLAGVHPAAKGQAFNSAPDPAPTWREWLLAYRKLTGKPLRWFGIPPLIVAPIARVASVFAPKDGIGAVLPEMLAFIQKRTTYKMDKARALLAWENRVSLEDGIARSAVWLRETGKL